MALNRYDVDQYHQKRLKRNATDQEYGKYAPTLHLEDLDRDLLNSDEYRQQFQIQPLTDTDYQGFASQAQKMFDPVRAASANRLNKFRETAAADQRDLEQRLREQANLSVQGLEEGLNRRGLLQSGLNAAGQGAIQRDTTAQINRSSIQRALEDADRVLQEANFNTDLDKRALETADRLAEREFARRQNRAQVNTQNAAQNMQREQFDFNKTQAGGNLLQQPEFMDLILQQPELAKQLLQQYGFTLV